MNHLQRILIFISITSFCLQCEVPALNNPADPLSDEYGKNVALSQLIAFWLSEKIAPDGLVVAVTKSTLPYEAGFRIYRVDSDLGLTSEFDSDVRTATTAAFPGCSPVRVAIPPSSRDIITLTGAGSHRFVVHRYGIDRTLSLLQDQNGMGSPSFVKFTSDGKTAFSTDTGTDPNTIFQLARDKNSGILSLNNGGSYPFSVGCTPVSLNISNQDNLVFTATSSTLPLGIFSFKKTGEYSGAFASGSPYDPADNPSQNNNLCVVENDRLLYMTSNNATTPIYGFRYDENGNMSLLPNSPFSPDPAITAVATGDNSSTSLALNPDGRYLAYLYQASGTFYLRLISIDPTTGNLTPTDQKFSVGNGPKYLEWDGSGRFLYLASDTGGSTNNFQLEYFSFTKDGVLTRGVNSPITVGAMTGGFAPRHMKAIQRYY
ncbi:hypothetical protein EHQ91_01065 [Leptospira biflexa]|uniref:hypothetical protein n=1 Tax=Leptospira biflexa TaxID=172 RepID=UPI0010917237|nr:hypothetical protein [Leptospira biflexa]TGM57475.1 hypothetical protein EHQ91_01065 [Leptospira biflexa]